MQFAVIGNNPRSRIKRYFLFFAQNFPNYEEKHLYDVIIYEKHTLEENRIQNGEMTTGIDASS